MFVVTRPEWPGFWTPFNRVDDALHLVRSWALKGIDGEVREAFWTTPGEDDIFIGPRVDVVTLPVDSIPDDAPDAVGEGHDRLTLEWDRDEFSVTATSVDSAPIRRDWLIQELAYLGCFDCRIWGKFGL